MFSSPEEGDDEVYRRVLKQKVRSLPPEAQAMILDFCRELEDAIEDPPPTEEGPSKKNSNRENQTSEK